MKMIGGEIEINLSHCQKRYMQKFSGQVRMTMSCSKEFSFARARNPTLYLPTHSQLDFVTIIMWKISLKIYFFDMKNCH